MRKDRETLRKSQRQEVANVEKSMARSRALLSDYFLSLNCQHLSEPMWEISVL